MVWISIEGIIGCGKTTAVNKLKEEYETPNFAIYSEPIEKWKYFLDIYYQNNKNNGFKLQTRTNVSFSEIFKKVENKYKAVTERSSFSAQFIFSKMMLDNNLISKEEYDLLWELVQQVQTKNPDYFIYLRTHPNVCYQRILERGEHIDINYLNKLCYYHDNVFLQNENTYIIDTTYMTKDKVFNEILNIIRTISKK